MIYDHLCGWKRDDDAVGAFTERLHAIYGAASFSDSKPELRGYWQRLSSTGVCHVLAQTAEAAVCLKSLPADYQERGTCVSRGTYRACQDSYYHQLANGLLLGRPARLAFEPIYGGSRVDIGGGQLGRGDGSVGAWAAEFVSKYGLLERAQFGSWDLSSPNEDLAINWGQPGRGVPDQLLEVATLHQVICHRVTDCAELADCIAAGYFAAYCSDLIWGQRDRNGMARPQSHAGHCEEVCGVFLTPSGATAFVRQQSWGPQPYGPRELATQAGPITLREGSYGAYGSDLQRGLDEGGECWCFRVKTPWTASVHDLLA